MLSHTTTRAHATLTSQPTFTSIEQTVAAVQNAAADSPIVVDFDETLFLRNSTEEYLRSIYPRTLGAGFIFANKILKPWRLLPQRLKDNDISKDWFLVVVATLLFPWTALVWQYRAKKLARQYCNTPLAQAIDSNQQGRLVIATLGFDWVVKPLLRHLPMKKVQTNQYQLVACRFWQGASDRAKGKLAMVSQVLGTAAVAKSVVVTDAEKDMPILAASAKPCLLKWPDARYIPSIADVYIPLFYSEKVKNAGYSHIVKHVILAHWLFLVLASSIVSSHPALHSLSLFLLSISYWCVYEIGYWENDILGEKYEKKPALSKSFAKYKSQVKLNTPWPWLWAMGLAIPACFLLVSIQLATPETALSINPLSWGSVWAQGVEGVWTALGFTSMLWLAFLGAVRLTFRLYNRFNEDARMWMYPILQTQKMFGFAMLVQVSEVGAMLLMSLIVSRWIEYCIYRCGGDRKRFPISVSTLMMFTLLFAGAATSSSHPEVLMSWQAVIVFGFCFGRSFKKLRQVLAKLDLVVNSRRKQSVTNAKP